VGADYPERLMAFLKARHSRLAELIRDEEPAIAAPVLAA
jgi:hypothetical protein